MIPVSVYDFYASLIGKKFLKDFFKKVPSKQPSILDGCKGEIPEKNIILLEVVTMASLSFKDFDLNQTCITGRRNPVVTLDAIRIRYKTDAVTKQRTDEVDSVVADIIARNRIQSVKLPLEAVPTELFEKIETALKNHKVVKVNFGANSSTMRGKCYALMNNGNLISGISVTANQFNLVSIEEPEMDEYDDLDIDL